MKSGVSEKQCVWICGSDDHKVITTKEGTKRTATSLSISAQYRPLCIMQLQPVFELPSRHCFLLIQEGSESRTEHGLASRGLGSETEEGLRWGGDVRVVSVALV